MVRRRAYEWERLARGVYRDRTCPDPWIATLAAWQRELPRSTPFTSLTAARLWGLQMPPLPANSPLFAATPRNKSRSIRPGIRVARLSYVPAFAHRSGLLVTGLPDTLLACARDVSRLDLAVLIDSALHRYEHLALRPQLDAIASTSRSGVRLLREALPFADARAESAWETLLRLLHVSADIDVIPQVVLVDESGPFGRADLMLTGTKTLHEYDGADHRTGPRHRKDLVRERRLLAAGYARRGYSAVDVAHRPDRIVSDACATTDQAFSVSRMRAWEALWKDSLFSPTGSEAFKRRLGINAVATCESDTPYGAT